MSLRLLHTADWHLGHALHGLDRAREHRAFLSWLLGVAEREEANALLVAGDVFDASNPPASAAATWFRFLAEAWARLPGLQVLVIGGNHDSAARLDAPRPLLDAMGRLRVLGSVPRQGGAPDPAALAVPIADREGRVAAVAAAVPYLRPADLPAAGDAEAIASGTRDVYARALAAARARRPEGAALVALGHLHLAGGQTSQLSERRIVAGHLEAIPSDLFPDDVAYAALGHLHLAQRVGDREHVRYAGSPIPLSFDERGYPHQVVLVELEGDAPAAIRPLPVPRCQELRRIPGDLPRPLAEVTAALAALPDAGAVPEEAWPWLEVRVALSAPEPALRAILERAVEGKAARLVRIAPPHLTGTGRPLAESGPQRALSELGPEEVFLRKWARDHESPPPREVTSAFHELLDDLLREEEAA